MTGLLVLADGIVGLFRIFDAPEFEFQSALTWSTKLPCSFRNLVAEPELSILSLAWKKAFRLFTSVCKPV
jgi:hypothetical protein